MRGVRLWWSVLLNIESGVRWSAREPLLMVRCAVTGSRLQRLRSCCQKQRGAGGCRVLERREREKCGSDEAKRGVKSVKGWPGRDWLRLARQVDLVRRT